MSPLSKRPSALMFRLTASKAARPFGPKNAAWTSALRAFSKTSWGA
jgi:hypothetical protein